MSAEPFQLGLGILLQEGSQMESALDKYRFSQYLAKKMGDSLLPSNLWPKLYNIRTLVIFKEKWWLFYS